MQSSPFPGRRASAGRSNADVLVGKQLLQTHQRLLCTGTKLKLMTLQSAQTSEGNTGRRRIAIVLLQLSLQFRNPLLVRCMTSLKFTDCALLLRQFGSCLPQLRLDIRRWSSSGLTCLQLR